jgi:hypothetical protein
MDAIRAEDCPTVKAGSLRPVLQLEAFEHEWFGSIVAVRIGVQDKLRTGLSTDRE